MYGQTQEEVPKSKSKLLVEKMQAKMEQVRQRLLEKEEKTTKKEKGREQEEKKTSKKEVRKVRR